MRWRIATGTSASTRAISGPCGACGHDEDVHDVICRSEDCPDDTPMCLDCVLEAHGETDVPWHEMVPTPIEVTF